MKNNIWNKKGYNTMANENKLEDIIRTSLENIRSMIDANTVIGTPISTENGVTIIPISKVSVGYASGGLDFNGKHKQDNLPQNFGAGGGTGVSINPVGFLVIKSNGSIEMINVGQVAPGANDPIEQITALIERCPDIYRRIKEAFKKESAENTEEGSEAIVESATEETAE